MRQDINSIRRELDRRLRAIIADLNVYELSQEQIKEELHKAVERVMQE